MLAARPHLEGKNLVAKPYFFFVWTAPSDRCLAPFPKSHFLFVGLVRARTDARALMRRGVSQNPDRLFYLY